MTESMTLGDRSWKEFKDIRDQLHEFLQIRPNDDSNFLMEKRQRAREIVSEGRYINFKQKAGLNFEIDAFICVNMGRDYEDWMRFMADGRNSRLDFMDPMDGRCIDATTNIAYKPSKSTLPHKRLLYMYPYSNNKDDFCTIEYVTDACLREFRSIERSKPKHPFFFGVVNDKKTNRDLEDYIHKSQKYMSKLEDVKECLPDHFVNKFVSPIIEEISKKIDKVSDIIRTRGYKKDIITFYDKLKIIIEEKTRIDYVDYEELSIEMGKIKHISDGKFSDDIDEVIIEINDMIHEIFSNIVGIIVDDSEKEWSDQLARFSVSDETTKLLHDEQLSDQIEQFIQDGPFTYDGFKAKHLVYYCHSMRVTHNMSMDIEEEFKILISRVLEYHGIVIYQSGWKESDKIAYISGGNETWKRDVYADDFDNGEELYYAELIEIFDQKNTEIEKIFSKEFNVSPEEFLTLGYATIEGEGYGYDSTEVDYIDRYRHNLDFAKEDIEMSFIEERIGKIG